MSVATVNLLGISEAARLAQYACVESREDAAWVYALWIRRQVEEIIYEEIWEMQNNWLSTENR